MEHHICTGGCRGVSEEPGICRAPDCPRKGEPLEKCDCENGEHHGAFQPVNDSTNSDHDA